MDFTHHANTNPNHMRPEPVPVNSDLSEAQSAAVDIGSPETDRGVAQPSDVLSLIDTIARQEIQADRADPTQFNASEVLGQIVGVNPNSQVNVPPSQSEAILNNGRREFNNGIATTANGSEGSMAEFTPSVESRDTATPDALSSLHSIVQNYSETNLYTPPESDARGAGFGAPGSAKPGQPAPKITGTDVQDVISGDVLAAGSPTTNAMNSMGSITSLINAIANS